MYYISTEQRGSSDDEEELDGQFIKESFDHIYKAIIDQQKDNIDNILEVQKDTQYQKTKEEESLLKFKLAK